jgi:predicted nucleic acid-binding protein
VRHVFADTHYWIALLNDRDQAHTAAVSISQTLWRTTLVTTQEILSEVLTYFSGHGPHVRRAAAAFVRNILNDPAIEVRPQSDRSFHDGLTFYEARPDKGYSLVDCISMTAMREDGITEVLSHDDYFVQEGFARLL